MDFTVSDELKQIQSLMRQFVRQELMPLESLVEERGEFPEDIRQPLIQRANELGLRNLLVPERFGGGGVGALGQALAEEEVRWTSPGVSWGVVKGWGWGGVGWYVDAATPEQMERYFLGVRWSARELTLSLLLPLAWVSTTPRSSDRDDVSRGCCHGAISGAVEFEGEGILQEKTPK